MRPGARRSGARGNRPPNPTYDHFPSRLSSISRSRRSDRRALFGPRFLTRNLLSLAAEERSAPVHGLERRPEAHLERSNSVGPQNPVVFPLGGSPGSWLIYQAHHPSQFAAGRLQMTPSSPSRASYLSLPLLLQSTPRPQRACAAAHLKR